MAHVFEYHALLNKCLCYQECYLLVLYPAPRYDFVMFWVLSGFGLCFMFIMINY